MSLEKQLKEARQALEDLSKDEAELSRLETEQAAEIAQLKASGSKDFGALATLEGKRAALASMLAEQRQAINRARDEVNRLEDEEARQERIQNLRRHVKVLQECKNEADAALIELEKVLSQALARVVSTRQTWADALEVAQEEVQAVFDLRPLHQVKRNPQEGASPEARAWWAALEELGEGAYTALTLSPDTQVGSLYSIWQPYQRPGILTPPAIERQAVHRAEQYSPADLIEPAAAVVITETLVKVRQSAPGWLSGAERVNFSPLESQGEPETRILGGNTSIDGYSM